jgi:hypothetical protein
LVQVRRGYFKQQAGSGSPPVGEPVVTSSAVVRRYQPDPAAALTESTALSRAISGTPVPEGDTDLPRAISYHDNQGSHRTRWQGRFSGACSALMNIDMLLYIIENMDILDGWQLAVIRSY